MEKLAVVSKQSFSSSVASSSRGLVFINVQLAQVFSALFFVLEESFDFDDRV